MSNIELEKYQKKHVIEYINDTHLINPLVSVLIITFNHVKYISECIEGVLMQKVEFPLEIIIGEDESNDGTREICIEYAKKYPDKIRLLLNSRDNNIKVNGQPTGKFNVLYSYSKVRGKYIAVCEGDDYWTDPYKLQKQVDFLEANPEYSISFHAAKHLDVISGREIVHGYKCKNGFRSFTAKDAIRKGGGFMTTNSMVFRTVFITHLPEWVIKAPAGDYALSLLLASKGHIGYLDDIMSVYRKNVPGSMASNIVRNLHNVNNHRKNTNKMLFGFSKYTKHNNIVLIFIKILNNYFYYNKHYIKTKISKYFC